MNLVWDANFLVPNEKHNEKLLTRTALTTLTIPPNPRGRRRGAERQSDPRGHGHALDYTLQAAVRADAAHLNGSYSKCIIKNPTYTRIYQIPLCLRY